MRTALLLLTYAAVLATLGAGLLRRARWVDRAPRLGVAAWQVFTGSIVTSTVLAGLALTVPTWPVAANLAEFLHACVLMLQAQYATPAGAAVATTGLALAAGTTGRAVYCLAREWRTVAAGRRRHLERLALLGHAEDRQSPVVVDHAVAEVYCVPGRRGRIVLTSAALGALTPEQLSVVLAHERAHLRSRHDLAVAAADAFARAFPFLPAFTHAREQVRRLVELAADDAAAAAGDRLDLAEGILAVAHGRTPSTALGAGTTAAGHRVRRLLAPHRRLGPVRVSMVTTALAVLLVTPGWLAAAPALAAADSPVCPLPPVTDQLPLPPGG